MLTISTSGRYAVRILVYMAQNDTNQPASKQDIAKAENISPLYAEQILLKLKNGGIITSKRGPGGGFVFAMPPERITVEDVLRLTEGPIRLAPCYEENCDRGSFCVTKQLWDRAGETLENIFKSETIAKLAQEAKKKHLINYQI